jgi:uncharacterized protein (DUF305 family)
MTTLSLPRARAGRRTLALAAALLATVTVSACGGTDDAAGPPSAVQTATDGSTFNQADVDFATRMIPHHAQAVQMVVMAQGRDLDPEVAALMEQIRSAQVPEIESMSDWLSSWGEPVPETSLDHSNAGGDMMDMDMGDMSGMMTADQMGALESATGSGFQDMWLTMMVAHHEGAIEKAAVEVEEGTNADATALAADIIESQTAEIDTIEELLR